MEMVASGLKARSLGNATVAVWEDTVVELRIHVAWLNPSSTQHPVVFEPAGADPSGLQWWKNCSSSADH